MLSSAVKVVGGHRSSLRSFEQLHSFSGMAALVNFLIEYRKASKTRGGDA